MARIETSTTVVLDDGTRVSLSPADIYVVGYLLHLVGHAFAKVAFTPAIKYIRLQHCLSLQEAKDVVGCLSDNRTVFGTTDRAPRCC